MKTIQTLMIVYIMLSSLICSSQIYVSTNDTTGWTKRIELVSCWGDGSMDTAYSYYKIDTTRMLIYFIDTANRMYGQIQWTLGYRIVTKVRPESWGYTREEDCIYLDYRQNPFRQSIIRLENIH